MKRKTLSVGDGIQAESEGWTFGGEVWRHFDSHINRSIPFYPQLHQLIGELATAFVSPGGRIYELGCSTGTLCRLLEAKLPGAHIEGVDIEPNMIAAAKQAGGNTVYHCQDIRDFDLEACDFAVLCYSLQFLPAADRPALLQRLYQQLQPGKALVLAEKVKRRDDNFDQLLRELHRRYKFQQGYTPEEIAAKDESLNGVLTPLYDDENIRLLEEAGFSKVHTIFRNLTFDAWLAIK